MPLIMNHAQTPPGGYRFQDPSGVPIRGDNLKELIDNIADFRKNNGYPRGKPYAEVEAMYAKECPWLITKVGDVPAEPEDPVKRWLNRIWKAPPPSKEFLDWDVVAVRTAVCERCPHYDPEYAGDADTHRRLAVLSLGRVGSTQACRVHHWLTALATLIPNPDTTVAVEGCWASRSSAPEARA